MNFGRHSAGDTISLEVWDNDKGFTLQDDLVGTIQVPVIGCSMFSGAQCSEQVWMPFGSGSCYEGGSTATLAEGMACVLIVVRVVPFSLSIDVEHASDSASKGALSMDLARTFPNGQGGLLYTDSGDQLNADFASFVPARGGVILKTKNADKAFAGDKYVTFTISQPSDMYVFRTVEAVDLSPTPALPSWMSSDNGWSRSATQLAVRGGGGTARYRGYVKSFRAGSVTLGGPSAGTTPSRYMYVVVAQMQPMPADSPADPGKIFDRSVYLRLLPQFLVPFVILFFIVFKFLHKIRFRLSFIPSYLLGFTLPDVAHKEIREINAALGIPPLNSHTAHLVSTCFRPHLHAVAGLEFRRNVFYVTNIIKGLIFLPLLVLIMFGIVVAVEVRPVTVGLGHIFMGSGVMIAGFASYRWHYTGWRVTRSIALLFAVAFGLVLWSQLLTVFTDPADGISLFAITSAFLTLNMMPMVWIAFTNDSSLKRSLAQVTASITKKKKIQAAKKRFQNLGALGLRLAVTGKDLRKAEDAAAVEGTEGWARKKAEMELPWVAAKRAEEDKDGKAGVGGAPNPFGSIIGDETFTISKKAAGDTFALTDAVSSVIGAKAEEQRRQTRAAYVVALSSLAALSIVVWSAEQKYPNQGIATALAVIALDFAMYLLYRGGVSWSPGYMCLVSGSARAALAAFVGEYWLAGHSLAFLIFGLAICLEIIHRRLPTMSKAQAGAIAYFGIDPTKSWNPKDIAGAPEFILGYLSLVFIVEVLGTVFAIADSAMPQVSLLGDKYDVWVFGVAAFLITIDVGLAFATLRAFHLDQLGLLYDQHFLVGPKFRAPYMFACLTELLVVMSGVLMYAITSALVILIIAIVAPLVVVAAGRFISQWAANDYQLLEPAEKRVEGSVRAKRQKRLMAEAAEEGNGEDNAEGEGRLFTNTGKAPANGAGGGGTAGLRPTGAAGASAAFALPPLKKSAANPAPPKPAEAQATQPASLPGAVNDSSPAKPAEQEAQAATAGAPAGGIDLDSILRSAEQEAAVVKKKSKGAESPGSKSGEAKLSLRQRFEQWKSDRSDPLKMTDLEAFLKGYLTGTDYGTILALFASVLLVIVMGAVIDGTDKDPNPWTGQAIWVVTLVLASSILPVVKYFNTYEWSIEMYASLAFSMTLLTIGVYTVFGVVGKGSVNEPLALWLFFAWIGYPTFLLGVAGFLYWRDNFWIATRFVKVSISVAAVVLLAFFILCYAFLTTYWGFALTCVYIGALVLLVYTKVWAENEFYLPPFYTRLADIAMVVLAWTAVVCGILFDINLFFAFAVAFVLLALRHAARAVSRIVSRPAESPLFFSQFIFPMYSYDPETQGLVSENQLGLDVMIVLAIVLACGTFASMFVDPVGLGVGISCAAINAGIILLAYSISAVPLALGGAARFVDEWLLAQSGETVKAEFTKRRQPLDTTCEEFAERDRREAEMEARIGRLNKGLGVKKEATALRSFGDNAAERETAAQVALQYLRLEYDLNYKLPWDDESDRGVQVDLKAPMLRRLDDPQQDSDDELTWNASSKSRAATGKGSARRSSGNASVAPNDADVDMDSPRAIQGKSIPDPTPKPKSGEFGGDSPSTRSRDSEDMDDGGARAANSQSGEEEMDIPTLEGATAGAVPQAQKGAAPKAPKRSRRKYRDGCCFGTVAPYSPVARGWYTFIGRDLRPLDPYAPVRRVDGLMTWREAWKEIVRVGSGPMGWLTIEALGYKLYVKYQERRAQRERNRPTGPPSFKYRDPEDPDAAPEVDADINGTPQSDTPASPTAPAEGATAVVRPSDASTAASAPRYSDQRDGKELVMLWQQYLDHDESLAREFYEEMRAVSHFQILVLVASDAKLNSEAVLFQKFLREYRFKLMANDVQPPADIFTTQSYATVNVRLVATWLNRLTPEQRQRFRQLKTRFDAEVDAQFQMRLQSDYEEFTAAGQLLAARRAREHEMWTRRWEDYQRRRIARKQRGVDNPDQAEDEINATEIMREINTEHLHCEPGQYGREWQFKDPEFPHMVPSLGPCQRIAMVKGWRPAHGINANSGLFKDGTDPDDVFQGQLADGWLLSAISIVAASGGIGDGLVDELIDSLFLTKATSDTGMYLMRLYKNAQWEHIVLDDYFPVLDIKYKATKCGGGAFAYSEGFDEIWVPLIEKAFAKYYGSYAAIEQGYVHHALQDLTGGDSEEIFLAEASRGANKAKLWRNLLQWRENRFLMGAGTVMPNANDRELMDSGLVFGAAYVIYDVVAISGYKLIKMRNPPGDHGEWQGDWGDSSPLWTKRLKNRLGWSEEDDGCFWMSFDDFCQAFRSVYLCRWFDPEKWHKEVVTGYWKGPLASGLPSFHNRDCKLYLNPQYSLYIDRPTDICLNVSQSLPDVTLDNNPQPIAAYIVSNSGSLSSQQILELNEKRRRDLKAMMRTDRLLTARDTDEETGNEVTRVEQMGAEAEASDDQVYSKVEQLQKELVRVVD